MKIKQSKLMNWLKTPGACIIAVLLELAVPTASTQAKDQLQVCQQPRPQWAEQLAPRHAAPELKHLIRRRTPPGWAKKLSPGRFKAKLPETQLLLQNDRLFPGQSRTQAMALEAETGHLRPEEDAVLLPLLRQSKYRHLHASRRLHTSKKYGHIRIRNRTAKFQPGILRTYPH